MVYIIEKNRKKQEKAFFSIFHYLIYNLKDTFSYFLRNSPLFNEYIEKKCTRTVLGAFKESIFEIIKETLVYKKIL